MFRSALKTYLRSVLRDLDPQIQGVIRGMSVADGVLISPASDCNSNNLNETSCVSNASSQDFVQDNSDYQWILDFGDREGSVHHHASILSSSYYTDDVALDFDANLAEVDMENFRREDINDFLHSLPSICCPAEMQMERQGEMFASVSGSMMVRFDLDSSMSPHSSSQEESNESSICKSELLFSPVKDTLLPVDANYSVDSLDCGEQDMMLTCLANKENYTIAFEGSTLMHGSDDYQGTEESEEGTATTTSDYSSTPDNNSVVSHNNVSLSDAHQKLTKKQQIAMTSSEALYTTWSKLKDKHSATTETLRRHPSGNNNITQISNYSPLAKSLYRNISRSSFLKSLSLSELDSYHQMRLRRNKPYAFNSSLLASFENEAKLFGNVKIFNIQNRSSSESSTSLSTKASTIHYTTPQHKANFSLVKLFIEQKSASNYAIDQSVSSERGYWTSSNTNKNDSKIVNKQYKISKSLSDNLNNKSLNKMNKINENDSVTTFEDSLMSQNKDKTKSQPAESIALLCSCNEENDIDLDDVLMNSFSLQDECDPNAKSCQNINYKLQKMYYENNKLLSEASKRLSSRCLVHTVDRSMQTSLLKSTSPTSLKVNTQKEAPLSKNNNASTSSSAEGQDPIKKPVYIMYPNYTLPDLKFLKNPGTELDLNNVFLMPQKFVTSPTSESAPQMPQVPDVQPKPRPFSCGDLEALKKKGFGHIREWDSLAMLLPRDYRRVLSEVPELHEHFKDKLDEVPKPLFCLSPPPYPTNPKRTTSQDFEKPKRQSSFSSDGYSDCENRGKNGSFSSTATHQGSSGYRGSSTILSDSGSNQSHLPGSNPMFVYKYDSAASSETSLKTQKEMRTMENERKASDFKLKSILRNASLENLKSRKNTLNTKRYSMFEFGDAETNTVSENNSNKIKRRSLPEHLQPNKEHVPEDEGIMCYQDDVEARRLEDLLEISGGFEQWQEVDMAKLRAQVSHFLSQANRKSVSFNQTTTPLNSPNISSAPPYRLYQGKSGALSETPIKEEGESPESLTEQLRLQWITSVSHKKGLIETVKESSEYVIASFQADEPDCVAQLVLNNLCPALYAVLSDGLKPTIQTAFGDIHNSVWHVVETSAQQGPITKGLNELVLKLNSEDVLTEGLIKFNAFIFGLLNVHGLDAWFGYLRTRESLLSKHYSDEGLLLSACRSGSTVRGLVDLLITCIRPLAELPFKLDLLYECKQLHQSLLQISRHPLSPVQSSIGSNNRTSWTLRKLMRSLQSLAAQSTSEHEDAKQTISDPVKARPRSCVDSADPSDVASTAQKRWSGVLPGSKLVTAFQRLGCDEDEYTEDSLEPNINNFASNNNHNSSEDDTSANTAELESETLMQEAENLMKNATKDGKFKRLQLKWEMLSSKDTRTPTNGRLSTPSSPAKSCGSSASGASYPRSRIPRPVSSPTRSSAPMPPVKKVLSPSTQQSSTLRKPLSTPNIKKQLSAEVNATKPPAPSRISRADLGAVPKPGAVKAVRPSSLPYRNAFLVRPSKASESSKKIPQSSVRNRSLEPHKYVQTLLHRLPSDSGHLSFNEGEKLRLVLEVDEKWLLCCRGDQKGLVPRSAVIACSRY
nr:PREDICTED: uncharacterized protein LOC109042593 isoform X3 [Bemisia tabaci]